MGVAKGIYQIEYEKNIKPYTKEVERWTKTDIMAYLEQKCFTKPSGFTVTALPDRRWLLDTLHTYVPGHSIFTSIQADPIYVEVPIWYFLNLNNFKA